MMQNSKIQESIQEIFDLYKKRNFLDTFTLESINDIFEIGNEVFMKNNAKEIEKLSKHPKSKAPDLLDDEPFSFERTFEIYNRLQKKYNEITPELIRRVFEINSQLAWEIYRKKYTKYIQNIYPKYPDDEYINYLAAVVLYDQRKFAEALKCINLSISNNGSSANYTHIKGLCMMQLGEFEKARNYYYQALFLIELMQDTPHRVKEQTDIYPNYPIEFHTSSDLIRGDLRKLDRVEDIFQYEMLPLIY